MLVDILYILGSYLLGSVPHLKLLAKLRHINLEGDFHQTLWNRAGKVYGVIGVLAEFIKGILPVLAGRALDLGVVVITIAGLAAVSGQMWPVFSKFDGKKGNSIAIAMVIALTPIPALVAMVSITVALAFRTLPRLTGKARSSNNTSIIGGPYSRCLPLGMAVYFLILPLIAWCFGKPIEIVWGYIALFVIIIIRRLTTGLGDDLKTGEKIKIILMRRLFYDRPANIRQ